MGLGDFLKTGKLEKKCKTTSDNTKFDKHRMDNYKRPEFEEIKDKFKTYKSKCKKNEKWLYIEYYKQGDRWEELNEIIGKSNLLGQSKHELHPDWFYNLIKKASQEKWFNKLGTNLRTFLE